MNNSTITSSINRLFENDIAVTRLKIAAERDKRIAELQQEIEKLTAEVYYEGINRIKQVMEEYGLTANDIVDQFGGKAIPVNTRKSRGSKSFIIRMKHPTNGCYIDSCTDDPKTRIRTMKSELALYAKNRNKTFRKYETFVGVDEDTIQFEILQN